MNISLRVQPGDRNLNKVYYTELLSRNGRFTPKRGDKMLKNMGVADIRSGYYF